MTLSRIWCFAVCIVTGAMQSHVTGADQYGIFKSGDRGQSWIRSDAGMHQTARINALGEAHGLFLAGTDDGLFISTDAAASWQLAGGVYRCRIISLAASGQRVFAGTDGEGLWVSGDGGSTWAAERVFASSKLRCMFAYGSKIYVC